MGCVRASGAPDGSLRQPETTHEVILYTRSCERVAQKTRKNAKMFKVPYHNGYITDEKMTFTKVFLFSRRMIYLYVDIFRR